MLLEQRDLGLVIGLARALALALGGVATAVFAVTIVVILAH